MCIRDRWSTITAYDLNTGKIKWQTPYGDLPEAGPSDKMRGNAYPKSGFVITAGGLVLFAGNDAKLYALNSATGKLIFSKELPNGSQGVPAVYEVNGREYIPVSYTHLDVYKRQPFSSGPWQTWQFCSYTARPICSAVGKPALAAAGLRGPDGINPPAFAAVDSPAGTSLTIDGISLDRT